MPFLVQNVKIKKVLFMRLLIILMLKSPLLGWEFFIYFWASEILKSGKKLRGTTPSSKAM
jgi:hypothetical protein